ELHGRRGDPAHRLRREIEGDVVVLHHWITSSAHRSDKGPVDGTPVLRTPALPHARPFRPPAQISEPDPKDASDGVERIARRAGGNAEHLLVRYARDVERLDRSTAGNDDVRCPVDH